MMSPDSIRVLVRLTVEHGSTISGAGLQDFASQLRDELLAVGVEDIAYRIPDPAPDGTKVADVLAVAGLLLTIPSTTMTVMDIVDRVHRWRDADRGRSALNIAVEQLGTIGTYRPTNRSALIIANSRYADPALRSLRSPGSDAQALADVLGDPAIGGFDVQLLLDESETTIRRGLNAFFSGRDRDDLLLVYFSGHGVKDLHGELFLAAADTEMASLSVSAVPAALVADQMRRSVSRRIVLILDCCYSGAFARGAVTRGDRSVHLEDQFSGVPGRVVLTASTATEYAFEGDQLAEDQASPSVYTSALVQGLRTGAADLNRDGEITIDELHDYVLREVRQTRSDQMPMKWVLGLEASPVIARAAVPVALPQQLTLDIGSNSVDSRLHAVSVLAAMLVDENASLRLAADHALTALRDNDDSLKVRRAATDALAVAPKPTPPVPRQRTTRPSTPRPASIARNTRAWWRYLLLALAAATIVGWIVATIAIEESQNYKYHYGYDNYRSYDGDAYIVGMLISGVIALSCAYLWTRLAVPRAHSRGLAFAGLGLGIVGLPLAAGLALYSLGAIPAILAILLWRKPLWRRRLAAWPRRFGGWWSGLAGPAVAALATNIGVASAGADYSPWSFAPLCVAILVLCAAAWPAARPEPVPTTGPVG